MYSRDETDMNVKDILLQPGHPEKARHFVWFSSIALVCLSISQFSSYLIEQAIAQGDSLEISAFLHFTHIRNMGGVFGMAQGHGWVFALFSVALIAGLIAYLWRSRQVRVYEFICFGLVAGGGMSNILDRLIYGSVIDFIDLKGIPYWHYVFNTADTFIHMGLWPMLFISIFLHKDNQ